MCFVLEKLSLVHLCFDVTFFGGGGGRGLFILSFLVLWMLFLSSSRHSPHAAVFPSPGLRPRNLCGQNNTKEVSAEETELWMGKDEYSQIVSEYSFYCFLPSCIGSSYQSYGAPSVIP